MQLKHFKRIKDFNDHYDVVRLDRMAKLNHTGKAFYRLKHNQGWFTLAIPRLRRDGAMYHETMREFFPNYGYRINSCKKRWKLEELVAMYQDLRVLIGDFPLMLYQAHETYMDVSDLEPIVIALHAIPMPTMPV